MNIEKINELLSGMTSESKIAILTHKSPDPDAIGSISGIKWLLKKKLGIDAKAFYDGEISHQQNQTMVNVLEIGLNRIEEFDKSEYDHVIIVDATTKNSQVEHASLVIDHHRIEEDNAGIIIIDTVGAASTLVAELIKSFDLKFEDDMDNRVATALFFGIRIDTEDLIGETTTDRDYTMSQWLSEYIDRVKLALVVKYPLPSYYFELEKILNREGNSNIDKTFFVGSLGIISPSKRDVLPMLSDKMVRMEGIQTAIIFAVVGDYLEASVRSHNTSLDVNSFCKKIFGKEFAGGKKGMGGASIPLGILNYNNLPDELIDELWNAQKKSLFHKILHVAGGN